MSESQCGGRQFLLAERWVGRRQKVRQWLSAMHEESGPNSDRSNGSAWTAPFEDRGTFSADTWQCFDSDLRAPYSCDQSGSARKCLQSHQKQTRRESVSLQAAPTSLNKLLEKRTTMLSYSTRSDLREETNKISAQSAPSTAWIVSQSEDLQSMLYSTGSSAQHNPFQGRASQPGARFPSSERQSRPPPPPAPTKQSARSSEGGKVGNPRSSGGERTSGGGGGGRGGGSGGSVISSSSGSSSRETSNEPSNNLKVYHVRVLPAMCYLMWRPNMLRRECFMDSGQDAHLNALHPSSLPMDRLMLAVAARLGIEVHLLSSSRPDFDSERRKKFEYEFRWHTPNGPRIELGDRITNIAHPEDQNGAADAPVRIFISGSPGWLA